MEFINKIINYIIDFFKYLFNITDEDIEIHNRMNLVKHEQDKTKHKTKDKSENESSHKVYIKLSKQDKKYNLLEQFIDTESFDEYIDHLPYEPDKIETLILYTRIEEERKLLFIPLFDNIINIKINLLSYLFNLNGETPYYSQFIMSSNPDNVRDMTYDNITRNMNNHNKQLYSKTYNPKLVRLKNNDTLNYYMDNRHSYQIINRDGFEKIKRPCESLFLYECYTNVYSEIIEKIKNYDSFQNFYKENKTSLDDLTIPQCYIDFLTKNKEQFEEYKKKNKNYILPEVVGLSFLNEIYDIEYHIIWIVYINIKIRNSIQENIEKDDKIKNDYNEIVSYINLQYIELLELEKKKNHINGDFGYNKDKLELYKDYIWNENMFPKVVLIDNNLWLNKCLGLCNFSYELFVNCVLSKINMDEIQDLTNKEIHDKINELYKHVESIKKNIENFDKIMNANTQEYETKKIIRNYIKKILKSQLKGGKKKKTYKNKKQRRKSKKKSV
jgi:hypothetical protein